MVIDELIARLGFQVEGTNEIKKFEKTLEGAKKKVGDFATALNRKLFPKKDPMQPLQKSTGRLPRMFSAATAAAARFGQGLARVGVFAARALVSVGAMAAGFVGISAALSGLVLLAYKFAAGLAIAMSKAARLRKEMQLTAKGQRTTAANKDKIAKGLIGMGIPEKDAQSIVDGFADKADASIREPDKNDFFRRNKIGVLDKEGNQRDSAAVFLDVVKRYMDRQEQARTARTQAEKDRDAGRGGKAKAGFAKANALELENRKFADEAGFSDAFKGALAGLKSFAEYVGKVQEFNRLNPAPSKDQEERSARIADQSQKLIAIMAALATPLESLRDVILDTVLPALVSFGEALVSWGKRLGIINETNGEQEDRTARERAIFRRSEATTAQSPDVADAERKGREASKGAGLFKWLFGSDIDKARSDLAQRTQTYQKQRDAMVQNPRQAADPSLVEALRAAEAAMVEAARRLKEIEAQTSPKSGADAAGKAAQTKAESMIDQRKYEDIGNDKRNITVSTTVNATGLAEVASLVKQAVLGAVSTKAGNTSTAALTTP